MVDETTSDDHTATDKGVNVHSDTLSPLVHKSVSDISAASSTWSSVPRRSITDIKNEIQTVLDLMGPSTPTLPPVSGQNTSSEADNEDSTASIPPLSRSGNPSTTCSRHSYPTRSDSAAAHAGTTSPSTVDTAICCQQPPLVPAYCACAHGNVVPSYVNVVPCGNAEARKCVSRTTDVCKRRGLVDWLKSKSMEVIFNRGGYRPCDLYKINMLGNEEEGLPKRVVFDLVEGIPKPTSSNVATNTIRNPIEKCKTDSSNSSQKSGRGRDKKSKNQTNAQEKIFHKTQKYISCDTDGNTRIDFYYFDHGNAQYFNTTDTPPVMVCEIIAEKTEKYTTKFWAEFFASIHIGVSFCISFVLQLFKFLLYSIVRPLSVGLMQLASDYFFKPFLTTLFNGVIQPCLIFIYNIATSLRDLCDPLAEGCGYFLRELAVLFRAIRLCTYRRSNCEDSNCDCSFKKRKCEC